MSDSAAYPPKPASPMLRDEAVTWLLGKVEDAPQNGSADTYSTAWRTNLPSQADNAANRQELSSDESADLKMALNVQQCNGSSECKAETHIHGCYADLGKCDKPSEHRNAAVGKTWSRGET